MDGLVTKCVGLVDREAPVERRLRGRADPVQRTEPVVNGSGELGIGPDPQFERDIGDAEVVPVDQVAQPLEPLDLARAVTAMAARTAKGGDQACLFEVAQHPLRPAGRLGGLLNRQVSRDCARGLHDSCRTLTTIVSDY